MNCCPLNKVYAYLGSFDIYEVHLIGHKPSPGNGWICLIRVVFPFLPTTFPILNILKQSLVV